MDDAPFVISRKSQFYNFIVYVIHRYLAHILIWASSLFIILTFKALINNWQHPLVLKIIGWCAANMTAGYYERTIELIILVMLLTLFYAARRIIIDYKVSKLAKAAGLFYCSTNCNDDERAKSDTFLQEQSSECGIIYISCSTGYDTFARPSTPLYNALKNCHTIRVLLAHPDKSGLSQRASKLKIGLEEYKGYVNDSIRYLKEIRSDGITVELKAYEEVPFWKLIYMEPHHMWVQQYPLEEHVQKSTNYAFERKPKLDIWPIRILNKIHIYSGSLPGSTICDFMVRQFNKMWNRKNLAVYNFETDKFE
jgi:hypothetical protein